MNFEREFLDSLLEWVFLNSVVGAVRFQRAATGAGSVENGANKANRQPKLRPYATMVFGSISADVRAKTNPIPWSSSGITTARKIITNGQPRNDPTLRAGLPTLRAWARPRE